MKISLLIIEDVEDSTATILNQILKGMKTMTATMDQVIDKVTAQTTALGSLKAFVEGLRDQIKELKLSQVDQAKIDALFVKVSENDERIVDAMEENVVQAPVEEPTQQGQGQQGGQQGQGGQGGQGQQGPV